MNGDRGVDPGALLRTGAEQLSRGDLVAARRTLEKALRLRPNSPDVLQLLGMVLSDQGEHEIALRHLKRAVAFDTVRASTRFNLAKALHAAGRLDAALESFRIAKSLAPTAGQVHVGLGNVLLELGMDAQALESYQQATRCSPPIPDAYLNAAKILANQGDHPAALQAFEHALRLEPSVPEALFGKAASQQALCDWTLYDERVAACIDLVRRGVSPSGSLFQLLMVCNDNRVLRLAANRETSLLSRKANPPYRHRPQTRGRLRIAYFSADFRMHATSYLAAGLFEAHDRKRFEVIGVSLGANDKSSMRERVVKAFDRFEDVHGQANETIIRRIRDLNVDIAIDLNGFKRNARPAVFLNRVAPIQVNFLVFPGTSGMKTMDYIIADRFIATEDLRRNVSEKMVLLPNCYQANDDKKEIAEYTPRRDEEGLPPAGFVFCSFNQARKITPQMFDVWMRVLRDVPDSVLWLLSAAPAVIANLRASAERRSIDGQRLVFADHRPLDQHLARIRLADLFLDTFPCNAHTTASDALWAGCPVVTLTGNTFASRVCGSLLTTIGLPELSVETLKEYEELVLRLARHPQELQILKGRLAGNRLTSPLFDTKRFCLNLERAYEEMSRLARMGKAPEDIDVLETG